MKTLLISMLPTLLPLVLGGLLIPLLLFLWQRYLPRARTYGIAFKIGRMLATWASVKLGKESWAKVGNSITSTIYDWADGLRDGLRVDEVPNPTPPVVQS